MTTPTVRALGAATFDTDSDLSHNIKYPLTTLDGGVLVGVLATKGTSVTTYDWDEIEGWVEIGSLVTGDIGLSVAKKQAYGDEGGTETHVFTDAACTHSGVIRAMNNADFATIEAAFDSLSTSASPNPPAVASAQSTVESLIIAATAFDGGTAFTDYPTNYDASQSQAGTDASLASSADAVIPSTAALMYRSNWLVAYVDSEESVGEDGSAENCFDGDTATIWNTKYTGGVDAQPHTLDINLGASYSISGFKYIPRQDYDYPRIAGYEFYISTDGSTWGTAADTGTMADVGTEQEFTFSAEVGSYIRLVATSSYGGTQDISCAELNVLAAGVDPGVFTLGDALSDSVSATIAIHPATTAETTGYPSLVLDMECSCPDFTVGMVVTKDKGLAGEEVGVLYELTTGMSEPIGTATHAIQYTAVFSTGYPTGTETLTFDYTGTTIVDTTNNKPLAPFTQAVTLC